MENISSNENENTEIEYQGNKNIKLRKRGRPKGSKNKPKAPPQIKDKDYWIQWIKDNRVEFYNTSKKTTEFYDNLYTAYNTIYDTDKSRGKCGICDWNIIIDLKRVYLDK